MTTEIEKKRISMTQIPAQPIAQRRITVARFVLFWERFWPALLPILLAPAIFAIISLFDAWRWIAAPLHWSVLGLGGLWTGWAIIRAHEAWHWPSLQAGIERVEADSQLRHTPLQALSDTPFSPYESDAANALWARHQKEMKKATQRLRVKGAHATVDDRDPFALRFVLLGLIILGLVAAGSDWWFRLGVGLNPTLARQTIATHADVWIDPPDYTGLAPIYLLRNGEPLPDLADQITVPTGAVLTALVNGQRGATLSLIEDDGAVSYGASPSDINDTDDSSGDSPKTKKADTNKHAMRLKLALTQEGIISLRLGSRRGLWPIDINPDTSPVVTFIEEPSANKKRQITLNYTLTDDYGAKKANLILRLDPIQDRPLDAPDFEETALDQIREINLDGAEGPSGERQHTIGLDDDPWSGLRVLGKIVVTDGADQTGETQEVAFDIPGRPFFNPLAKAVIEQRQTLAVASTAVQKVRDAFNALTDPILRPEEFYEDTAEYLLLRTAFWRVQTDKDGDYEETIDHFWPLALELEDQALELARRRLDAAIEALRQSLENNASETVVNQRREDLEAAIQDYLQALAQNGIPDNSEGGGDGSTQIGRNDIEEMLNAIQGLSKTGANNAARQLLSDLENLLDNLQLSRGGAGQNGIPNPNGGGSQSQNGAGEQAGELIGRQRDLSNRSFERGQNPGASGDDLAAEQEELANDVEELLNSLTQGDQDGDNGSGVNPDPDGNAANALEDAIREMQRSQDALDSEDFRRAGNAMDRAIASLREGAQALAEAQAAQNGQNGEESGDGQDGTGDGNDVDPLGRTTGTGSGGVDVPDDLDPAKTREVIEELRRRLGEQGRSQEEIEYLERLLDAF